MSDVKPSDFLLTIKIPMTAFDSIQARMMAQTIMNQVNTTIVDLIDPKYKLQQIFPDKEPTGIPL